MELGPMTFGVGFDGYMMVENMVTSIAIYVVDHMIKAIDVWFFFMPGIWCLSFAYGEEDGYNIFWAYELVKCFQDLVFVYKLPYNINNEP